ncbi:uncharacterized protein [Narcine bancroftii]|uniref:uncharacterized protein n=1 Tax=Narcine bancroftii TaxID=1343680 RepID=UPI003831803E
MKVKRILKEPVYGNPVPFLRAEWSPNKPMAYRNAPGCVKQPFQVYPGPHLLPRQLLPAPVQRWPQPESVHPGLANFQSALFKSALEYTNQSLNLSVKKEAIALSCRPEAEAGSGSVATCSSAVPVECFSLQQVFSRPGLAQEGVSRPVLAQQEVSRPGLAQQGVSGPGLAQQGVSRPGLAQQGVSWPGLAQQEVSWPGLAQQGVFRPGLSPQTAARPAHLLQVVSRLEFMKKGHSFVSEGYKPTENLID